MVADVVVDLDVRGVCVRRTHGAEGNGWSDGFVVVSLQAGEGGDEGGGYCSAGGGVIWVRNGAGACWGCGGM